MQKNQSAKIAADIAAADLALANLECPATEHTVPITKCGKYNHNYVGTCGCGETKPFDFDFGATTKEEDTSFIPKSNAWKCPQCGKLNNNFVSICHCGYNNSDTTE